MQVTTALSHERSMTMGDKSPKNTAKQNKQKEAKKKPK
jgi:hypothetical protein